AQLAHLELELRAEDEAGARERGFELGRPLERGLRDIEREEHRLSRQKTKAAERLLLLGRELDGAKAFDRVRRVLEASQDLELALVVALRLRGLRDLDLELLDPLLDLLEVGVEELELDRLREPAPVRVVGRARLEGRDHENEPVGVAHLSEDFPPPALLLLEREPGKIEDLHLRLDLLLRAERLREEIEPRVRDRHDAEDRPSRAEDVRLELSPRDGAEEGRFAALRSADESEFHAAAWKREVRVALTIGAPREPGRSGRSIARRRIAGALERRGASET